MKFYWDTVARTHTVCGCFPPHWPSPVVATETVWSTEPKMRLSRPFTEKSAARAAGERSLHPHRVPGSTCCSPAPLGTLVHAPPAQPCTQPWTEMSALPPSNPPSAQRSLVQWVRSFSFSKYFKYVFIDFRGRKGEGERERNIYEREAS